MRPTLAIIAMATTTTLSVAGCANMTTTEQRVLSGAAIGALGGVAIAAIAETNIATGAAIGAGVGAGAGYLYSRSRNEHQAAYHPAEEAPEIEPEADELGDLRARVEELERATSNPQFAALLARIERLEQIAESDRRALRALGKILLDLGFVSDEELRKRLLKEG